MKFIVMGGDERAAALCRLLAEDGHGVFPMALDAVLPQQGPPDYRGSDGLILPLPAERGGLLNAPLCAAKLSIDEALAAVPAGTRVYAGMAGERLRQVCAEKGLRLYDYFEREDFQIKNAALTAEGALSLLLGADGRAMGGRRVLIAGFGRIGRLLALRLGALGLRVTVAARSAEQRAWAEAMGFEAVRLAEAHWHETDFVVNTVPHPIFGGREIAAFGEAKLLELASAPYGFDMAAAKSLGKEIILAPGLPARIAPESAAKAVMDTVLNMLEE